jgi:hypothetical protein
MGCRDADVDDGDAGPTSTSTAWADDRTTDAPVAHPDCQDVPQRGVWTPVAAIPLAGGSRSIELLPGGDVLVIGTAACDETSASADATLRYHPSTDTWATVEAPSVARRPRYTLPSPNGVVVVGAWSDDGAVRDIERYDADADRWTTTGQLPEGVTPLIVGRHGAQGIVVLAWDVTLSSDDDGASWLAVDEVPSITLGPASAVAMDDGTTVVAAPNAFARWSPAARAWSQTAVNLVGAAARLDRGQVFALRVFSGDDLSPSDDVADNWPSGSIFDAALDEVDGAGLPGCGGPRLSAGVFGASIGRVLVVDAGAAVFDRDAGWIGLPPLPGVEHGAAARMLPDGSVLAIGHCDDDGAVLRWRE